MKGEITTLVISSIDRLTGSTAENAKYAVNWETLLEKGEYKMRWNYIEADTNPPPPPTNLIATEGSTTASIAFTPSVGATSYTITSSPGGLQGTGSSSPIVVSGLTTSTPYTFTATATNIAGTSAPSAPSTSVSTYTFRVNSETSVVPTVADGFTITNTGAVAMINNGTRGFVFNLTGSKHLSIVATTPLSSTKTFWVSASPSGSDNTFSTTKIPIWFNGTNFLRATVNFPTVGVDITSTASQNNQWKHYAITTSATTTTLYVNGVLNASASVAWTGDTATMYFGAYQGSSTLVGLMDDIRFYTSILTATEIQNLYTTTFI